MNRSLLSLAAFATLCLAFQASGADKPPGAGARMAAPIPSGPVVAKPAPLTPPGPAPVATTKLVSAKFLKAEVKVGEPVSMKFDGINLAAGKMCGGTVTWGDGSKFDNMLGDNGVWGTISKAYAQAGNYTAVALPKNYSGNPCVSDGPIQVSIKVNPADALPPSQFTKLVITPMLDPKVRLISTKWVGTAPASMCFLVLNFGDGTSKQTGVGAIQPGFDTQHTYAPGTYTVSIAPIKADQNCTVGPDAAPKTFTVE